MISLTVDPQDDGVRLDRLLRRSLKLVTLTEIYRCLRKGGVKVNGKRCREENYRCKANDAISVALHAAEAAVAGDHVDDAVANLVRTDFFRRNFTLLYEDETLLVCNKPSGLVVHGGSGHTRHDTLLDLAASHCMRTAGRGKNPAQPQLVHRLDRDTSGVILIAKDRRLLRMLHESIRNRTFTKEYLALCWGTPPQRHGTIDASLVRDYDEDEGTIVRVSESGKESLSSYRVIASRSGASRVAVKLHTGRTHQIRVHMAHLSCPVIGDERYGDQTRDASFFERQKSLRRLYLHAASLSFFYPPLNQIVQFEAEAPDHFSDVWQEL
jgi:23S rRNA pseudouridine955/2504/2580 synthase